MSRRGEWLCDRCGGAGRKRAYMDFRKGWYCQFFAEDMKTPLPRTLTFADDRKIWEIAKRGGFTLNIAGRRGIEASLRKGRGNLAGSYAWSSTRSCGPLRGVSAYAEHHSETMGAILNQDPPPIYSIPAAAFNCSI